MAKPSYFAMLICVSLVITVYLIALSQKVGGYSIIIGMDMMPTAS